MTHILAIEGTGMRLEIETCHGCPLQDTDRDAMPSGCPYLDHREARDSDDLLEDCPLPLKVRLPEEECAGFPHIVDVRHQYGGIVVQFAPTEHETHSVLLTESCAEELRSLLDRALNPDFANPL